MARCNCAGGSCGCKVQAKDAQVTVTGTGTAQDPHVVGLGDANISNKLVITAGDGIHLVQGGSGTTADPKTLDISVYTGTDSTVTPLTGQTQSPTGATRTLVLTPAGTLAAQTIVLPLDTTALNDEIVVVSTQTITALTVTAAAGATVAGAPTTLAANGFFRMRLINTVWRRV